MKRIKIIKVYFILWLFIGFTIWAYWAEFTAFFAAAASFNVAVLAIMAIGGLFLMNAAINLVLLGGTFGALAYKRSGYEFYLRAIDKIMPANIAHMFYSRKSQEKMLFTQEESREVISWLEDSFASQRGYVTFFINTPLLIGLFGTFTGLLKSIDEMGRIVISLTGDVVLNEVIESFAGPLSGMAIGFGSSLFAVGIAVILGIKGYILFKYQDIMIEGVEEWLKGRIIDVSVSGEANSDLPDRKESFLDLFLGEMGKLTKEIGKVTEVNQTFALMSDSLVSLNTQAILQKEQTDALISVLKDEFESSKMDKDRVVALLNELSSHLQAQQNTILSLRNEGGEFNASLSTMLEGMGGKLENMITLLKEESPSLLSIENTLAKIAESSEKSELQGTMLIDEIRGGFDRIINANSAIENGQKASAEVIERSGNSLVRILEALESYKAEDMESLKDISSKISDIGELLYNAGNIEKEKKDEITELLLSQFSKINSLLDAIAKDGFAPLSQGSQELSLKLGSISGRLDNILRSIDRYYTEANENVEIRAEGTKVQFQDAYESILNINSSIKNSIEQSSALIGEELKTQREIGEDRAAELAEMLKAQISELKALNANLAAQRSAGAQNERRSHKGKKDKGFIDNLKSIFGGR